MAQTLWIAVKGDTKDLVSSLKKAENVTVSSGKKMTTSLGTVNKAYGALKTAVVAYLGVQTVKSVINIADTYSLLESRLKLVTSSSEELKEVQEELLEISNDSRVSYAATANLYARLGRSTEQLGTSSADLLLVTEAISKALIVSGATATEAENALIQLSQGLASGALRGDELRSVLEQVPRVAKAIADGMGITVGQLREFGKAGKLTAEAVIPALISQLGKINEEFGQIDATVAQSVDVFKNVFFDIIAGADKSSSASADLAESIMLLAKTIEDNKESIVGVFSAIASTVGIAIEKVAELSTVVQAFAALGRGDITVFEAMTSDLEELRTILKDIGNDNSFRNRLKELGAEQEKLSDQLKHDRTEQGKWFGEKELLADAEKKQIIERIRAIKEERNAIMTVAEAIKTSVKDSQDVYVDGWQAAKEAVTIASDDILAVHIKNNAKITKAEAKANEKRAKASEDLSEKIKKMTSSEFDFKKFMLEKEIKGLDLLAAGDEKVQNQIGAYRKLKLSEIVKDAKLASDAILKADKKAKDAILKAEKVAADKTEDIREDLADKIAKMSLSEVDYKKKLLDEEIRDLQTFAGKDADIQNKIAQYHKLKLEEITGYVTKMRDSWMDANGELKKSNEEMFEVSIEKAGIFFDTMTDGSQETTSELKSMISTFVDDLIDDGFDSLSDAWDGLWKSMVKQLSNALINMAAKWAASKVATWFTRLHTGAWKIASDEFPAILQQGEMVIPKTYAEKIRTEFGNSNFTGSFESLPGSDDDPSEWETTSNLGSEIAGGAISAVAGLASELVAGSLTGTLNASSMIGSSMLGMTTGAAETAITGSLEKFSPADFAGLSSYAKLGGLLGSSLHAVGLMGTPAGALTGGISKTLGQWAMEILGDMLNDREYERIRDAVEAGKLDPNAAIDQVSTLERLAEMSGKSTHGSTLGGWAESIAAAWEATKTFFAELFGLDSGYGAPETYGTSTELGGTSEAGGEVSGSGGDVESSPGGRGGVHGGMDFIPKETTYLLDKGERVLSPNQNSDLTQYLRDAKRKTGDGVNVTIMLNGRQLNSLIEDVIVERNKGQISSTGRIYGY